MFVLLVDSAEYFVLPDLMFNNWAGILGILGVFLTIGSIGFGVVSSLPGRESSDKLQICLVILTSVGIVGSVVGFSFIGNKSAWNESVSSLFDERISSKTISDVRLFEKVSKSFVGTIPVTLTDGSQAVLFVDGKAAKLTLSDPSSYSFNDVDGEELEIDGEVKDIAGKLSELTEDERRAIKEFLD